MYEMCILCNSSKSIVILKQPIRCSDESNRAQRGIITNDNVNDSINFDIGKYSSKFYIKNLHIAINSASFFLERFGQKSLIKIDPITR